jgi:protein-tyrosine-phosphatase
MLPYPVVSSSAGFLKPGRQSPPAALAAAHRHQIEMADHRSVMLTQAALDAADLVVVMTPAQARAIGRRARPIHGTIIVLGDLDPFPTARRVIQDPWGRDDSVFESSYERIERCINALVETMAGWRQPETLS